MNESIGRNKIVFSIAAVVFGGHGARHIGNAFADLKIRYVFSDGCNNPRRFNTRNEGEIRIATMVIPSTKKNVFKIDAGKMILDKDVVVTKGRGREILERGLRLCVCAPSCCALFLLGLLRSRFWGEWAHLE